MELTRAQDLKNAAPCPHCRGLVIIKETPKISATGIKILTALSKRERQVLGLLLGGLSNRSIQQELKPIGLETVKRHVASIFDKCGMSSRLEVVVLVTGNGITEADCTPDGRERWQESL